MPRRFSSLCHCSYFGQCDCLKCRAASLLFVASLILAGAIPSNTMPLLSFCFFSYFGRLNSLECRAASFLLAGEIT
jgi:hypothetical protein